MEFEDLEDMLFGSQDSHNRSDEDLSDFSEQELLFTPFEETHDDLAPKDRSIYTPAIIDNADDAENDAVTQHEANVHIKRTLVHDRSMVISYIESVLEKIIDGLLEESDSLTITLKTRSNYSRRRKINDGSSFEPKERHVSFPGANAQEAWTFSVLLRILEIIHSGLVDNTIITKRDIYYRHPDLFVKQSVVDRYVDDLACTLGVTRSQLNVTAAAKGLIGGNFGLVRESGNHMHGMNEEEGMLIPAIGEKDELDLTSVHWVLVIEKEATFRSLLSSNLWSALGSHGIALTAKGYPDLASRKFLSHLMHQAPHVPMYAFMDWDPDGIAILSTYKYGSFRLAHEGPTTKGNPGLGLPGMRWLGVKSHHIDMRHGLQGLMKLTARDRSKAMQMLEWDLCAEKGMEQEWRQELQRMLVLNVKAEMQILDELSDGMVSWVRNEMDQAAEPARRQPINGTSVDDGMLF